MDECKNCIHYKACMHLIDTSIEELTVCEHFESKINIEELKSKNANLTSDLSSLRTEIEAYKKHIDNDIIYVDAVRAEAVKEFAERLKHRLERKYTVYGREYVLRHLRELVKEFTEGDPK